MGTLSTRKQPSIRWLRLLAGTALAGSMALAFGMIGCGGGGGGGGGGAAAGSAAVKSGISDPAQECTDTYSAVYVTVENVQANLSSSASSNSSTWQTLTPSLMNAPVQVNLLSTSYNKDCFLKTLGQTSGLPAGKYQQIRIFMVPNGTPVSSALPSNECSTLSASSSTPLASTVWNCVETTGGKWYPLTMPSNANTGLKIPPGQLEDGGLTVQNGKGLDLDIDVNACASVVETGHSGKYMFKPTLRASELGTNPLVAGNLYEASVSNGSVATPSASSTAVPGAMVWLEQQSTPVAVGTPSSPYPPTTTENVDNLIQTTSSDSSGHFEFCPVGSGTYEIVANTNSLPTTKSLSDTTITTGVNVTETGGPNNLVIPLVAAAGNATLSGNFTANGTVTNANVQYAPTQPFAGNSGPVQALEPAAMATPSAGTHPPTAQTPTGYMLTVGNGTAVVGNANTGYTQSGNATYSVWGSASSNSDDTLCSPSSLISNSTSSFPASGLNLAFQNCGN